MALVRCADCGKDRSDQVPACPHCGRPNPAGYRAAPGDSASESGTRRVGFVLVVAIIGLAFIALVGRQGGSPSESLPTAQPTDADLRAGAEVLLEGQLRDPKSAEYRNVIVFRAGDRTAVCGEVNARNGFGGFTGFTPFVVAGPVVSIRTARSASTFKTLWKAACTGDAPLTRSGR